ncbi:hypothetical protein [Salinicola halophyticus]|uniref:hypothetical protein n=1 Tax=Salinicola halophyticus TaxID=1808881 RepID=UPI0013008669|nr:hypothetical protein [Salinicola halophyticus]
MTITIRKWMRHHTVKQLARLLLEPCDPAKGQVPSATVTSDLQSLPLQERHRIDLLVARTKRIRGLRAHRRLPFFLRPVIAVRWGCFNTLGPELAPLAWLTRDYVRNVPAAISSRTSRAIFSR